jgi:SAM-dependent methyltransferase
MRDSWQTADPYEYYMGRWSYLAAGLFIDWISSPSGLKWLDVGCGSGALSEVIANHQDPAAIIAIDQSEGFVKAAQSRLGKLAECKVGNALSLPLKDSSVDIAVSGLVLNFIPEPDKALGEMSRVTNVGGTVAVYIWDYAGKMELLQHFWDAAVDLKPEAASLHESKRFPESHSNALRIQFENAGFIGVETASLDIITRFADFDDYWRPFLGGQGPAPTFVRTLDESDKASLRESLRERLVAERDGAINLEARAWAAKGAKQT